MKQRLFLFALIFTLFFACDKDDLDLSQEKQNSFLSVDAPTLTSKYQLRQGNLKMVPLNGYTIEVPFFTEPGILCAEVPYPSGFRDIGGEVSHLGNVTGGYFKFSSCNPGTLDGVFVFIAEYTGVFMAANGDQVNYEGSLTFDPTQQIESISMNYITGGIGRWKDAQGNFRYYNMEILADGTYKAYIDGAITTPGFTKKF